MGFNEREGSMGGHYESMLLDSNTTPFEFGENSIHNYSVIINNNTNTNINNQPAQRQKAVPTLLNSLIQHNNCLKPKFRAPKQLVANRKDGLLRKYLQSGGASPLTQGPMKSNSIVRQKTAAFSDQKTMEAAYAMFNQGIEGASDLSPIPINYTQNQQPNTSYQMRRPFRHNIPLRQQITSISTAPGGQRAELLRAQGTGNKILLQKYSTQQQNNRSQELFCDYDTHQDSSQNFGSAYKHKLQQNYLNGAGDATRESSPSPDNAMHYSTEQKASKAKEGSASAQKRQKSLNHIAPINRIVLDQEIQLPNLSKSSFFMNQTARQEQQVLNIAQSQVNFFGRQSSLKQHHLKIPSIHGSNISKSQLQSMINIGNESSNPLGYNSSGNIYGGGGIVGTAGVMNTRQVKTNQIRLRKGDGSGSPNSKVNQDLLQIESSERKSEMRVEQVLGYHAQLSTDRDLSMDIRGIEGGQGDRLLQENILIKDYTSGSNFVRHKVHSRFPKQSDSGSPHYQTKNVNNSSGNFISKAITPQPPYIPNAEIDLTSGLSITEKINSSQCDDRSSLPKESAFNKSSESQHSINQMPRGTNFNLKPKGIDAISQDDGANSQSLHDETLQLPKVIQTRQGPKLIQTIQSDSKNHQRRKDMMYSERYGEDGLGKQSHDQESEELDDFEDDGHHHMIKYQQYRERHEQTMIHDKDKEGEKTQSQVGSGKKGDGFGDLTRVVKNLNGQDIPEDSGPNETQHKFQHNHQHSPQTNFMKLGQLDDHHNYPNGSPIRKYTELQKQVTGGVSERSKKIVYQKGVNQSQNPQRIDHSVNISNVSPLNGANMLSPLDIHHLEATKNHQAGVQTGGQVQSKPNPSMDYDIVRDIGTNPIEDDSFLVNELSKDDFFLENFEILTFKEGEDDPIEESQVEQNQQQNYENGNKGYDLLSYVEHHNAMLLLKPATGWSQHRQQLQRKHPPKKLFDYLPKGRRIIMKDQQTGTFKVLIPLSTSAQRGQQRPIDSETTPTNNVGDVFNREDNIAALAMTGLNMNQLAHDWYQFRSKLTHQTHISQINNELTGGEQEGGVGPSPINDEKFIKLSLMEKMHPTAHLDALDGDYFLSNIDDIFDGKHLGAQAHQQIDESLREGTLHLKLDGDEEDDTTSHDGGVGHLRGEATLGSFHEEEEDRSQQSNHHDPLKDENNESQQERGDEEDGGDELNQKEGMSNLSNLTSYEFESKILKNNYQQYLLGQTNITNGDGLNQDLEIIQVPQKSSKNGVKKGGIKAPQTKQTLKRQVDNNVPSLPSHQRQRQMPLILNEASSPSPRDHYALTKQAHSKSKVPPLPLPGTIFKQEQPSKQVPIIKETLVKDPQQDPLNQSQGTLYDPGEKPKPQVNYSTTQRREDTKRQSVDLSAYSKMGGEYLTFHGDQNGQKLLKPIADIFINNRSNCSSQNQHESQEPQVPLLQSKNMPKQYHLKKNQRPVHPGKVSTVKASMSPNVADARVSHQKTAQGKKSPIRQEETVSQKSKGGLLSEISRQFSEAINTKLKAQEAQNLQVYHTDLFRPTQVSAQSSSTRAQKHNQPIRNCKSVHDQSPHTPGTRGFGFHEQDMTPHMSDIREQIARGMLTVSNGFNITGATGTPAFSDYQQRPNTTSLYTKKQAATPQTTSNTYEKYLRMTQTNRLQLLGRLNRKAAEARLGMRSVPQQQYFCFPQSLMPSNNKSIPEVPSKADLLKKNDDTAQSIEDVPIDVSLF